MEASSRGMVEASKKEKRRRWGVGEDTGRRTCEDWSENRASHLHIIAPCTIDMVSN